MSTNGCVSGSAYLPMLSPFWACGCTSRSGALLRPLLFDQLGVLFFEHRVNDREAFVVEDRVRAIESVFLVFGFDLERFLEGPLLRDLEPGHVSLGSLTT